MSDLVSTTSSADAPQGVKEAPVETFSFMLADRPKDPAAQDTSTAVHYSDLVAFIQNKFNLASTSRMQDEQRWLKAYQNYRGIYASNMQFTETEKSRVFIRVTKTKVLAAFGQIIEVLFGGGKFPLSIDPIVLPEGLSADVHVDPNDQKQGQAQDNQPEPDPYGYNGDGRDIPLGATKKTLMDMVGGLAQKVKGLVVKEGPGVTPGSVTLEPAMIAAKKMEKKIIDELIESDAVHHLRYSTFEMVLLGSGVMKGPLAEEKEYPKWSKEGEYTPILRTRPKLTSVSLWDFYVDPAALSVPTANFTIERHRMTREQLRELKVRPGFRDKAIEAAIAAGENYTKLWWEDTIRDYKTAETPDRFEVYEYWGVVDREQAETAGLTDIPSNLDKYETLQVNSWICGSNVLRLVINPFKPTKLPYYLVPYEVNPYSPYGIGLAENMEDTQTLMNGFMRLAVDNAVLSGNVILEMDEASLVPGQSSELYPGKIFRRQQGAPGQSVFAIQIPNVSQANMQLFDKARQLADEATGIQSYSHGDTGVQGVPRTASGMSMLMNASSTNIKTIVKNIDDYLLNPLGNAYFNFNNQFDFDPELTGNLEVNARGTDSLMQTEVRSQRLLTFLQVTSNPMSAPFVKIPYILREIAKSLDLDPDKTTNNPDEAVLQALAMQKMGSMNAPDAQAGPPGSTVPQGMGGSAPNAPPGANVHDATGTGGGQITPATPSAPGLKGFAANNGQGTGKPALPVGSG